MGTARARASALCGLLFFCGSAHAQFAGSKTCQPCHPDKFAGQSSSEHAHALSMAPKNSPGQWAFGAGSKATTYVSQVAPETYLEHGLTFYASTKSFALTPGHTNADGLRYRTFDPVASILRCFRCHSTGPLRLGPNSSVIPFETGVHCESCHGPGAAHVRAKGAAGTIQNPGRLSARELNVFCGTCHRKPPEVGEETDWSNAWNTRHEPDYLSHAACFRKSNGALSCLTCHDPHTALSRTAAEYDRRCSGCHRAVRHRTSIAARSCIDCHMPQVPTGPHLHFTNHWIGIYEKGSSLLPRATAIKGLEPLRTSTSAAPVASPADPATLRPLFEQALAEREKTGDPKGAPVARSASDLGLFLKSLNDPAAAVAPLTKALEIDTANSDPALPRDQENLGMVLLALEKRQDAYDLFRAAAQGSDPAVAARCLTELAALDPANAEPYYRLALQQEEKAAGTDSTLLAVVLNDLGMTLHQKNDNQAAEPLFRRALAIQEKALGPNSAAAATTLNNLGSLLQSTGQLDEAERAEERALRIFGEKLGPESVEVATTCSNLADLMWAKHDPAAAIKFYRRAISIDESIYGPQDPEVANDLANLGLLLKETGDRAGGDSLLRRAIAIYEKAFGAGNPQAAKLRESLESKPSR